MSFGKKLGQEHESNQAIDKLYFQSLGLTSSKEKESVAKMSLANPLGLNYFTRTSDEPKFVGSKDCMLGRSLQCVRYPETIISQQAQSNQSLSITRQSGIPGQLALEKNQTEYKDIRNNQPWRSRSVNIQLQIIKHLTEMDDKNILQGDAIKTQTVSGIKLISPQVSLNDLSSVDQDLDTIAENIDSTRPLSVQDLKQQVIEGYIWHSQQLYRRIAKIFSYYYKSTISQDQRKYLGDLWSSYQNYFSVRKILLDNRIAEELTEYAQLKQEADSISGPNQKIGEQVSKFYQDNSQIELYSLKKPIQCGVDCCCFDPNEIGDFDPINKRWISDCPNRSRNIECDHNCLNNSLDPDSRRRKTLLEKQEWSFSPEKIQLISLILQRSNEDILFFTKKFIEHGNSEVEKFDFQPRLKAFYKSQNDQSLLRLIGKEFYYLILHNKIQQILTPKLILRNNFISQPAKKFQLLKVMDGLMYKPWRWSEKQECMRQKQKETNLKQNGKEALVFYLETHEDDQIGHDMNIIDLRQNLEQNRLFLNSQFPNCAVITMISGGKYFVGFYSLRDIQVGEQLSLDYNSSYQNYSDLRGLSSQIQNIQNNKGKVSQNLRQKRINHQINMFSYLERTQTLFDSCISSEQNQQWNNYAVLNQTNVPQWLKNWASKIHHQIERLENGQTKLYLKQRLIFTLSKITSYNIRSNNTLPPLKLVDQSKLVDMFWKNWKEPIHQFTEQSIIQEVYYILKKYNSLSQVHQPLELIIQTGQFIEGHSQCQKLGLTRVMLLGLAFMLLNSDHENVPFNIQGLAMILLFLSFTHSYFSPEAFKGFQSETFNSLDLKSSDGLDKKCSKFCKKSYSQLYTPQFLWGEMIGWLKDHVANPQASMAQDRRGVLCYPSFIQSFDNGSKDFPWGCKTLKSYKNYIQQKFGHWAPDIQKWAYKNSHNVFGTIFFDVIIHKEKYPEDFFNQLFESLEDFNQLFRFHSEVEKNFKSTNIQIEEYVKNLIEPIISSHLQGNKRQMDIEQIEPYMKHSPTSSRRTRNQKYDQRDFSHFEPAPKKLLKTETEQIIHPSQSHLSELET